MSPSVHEQARELMAASTEFPSAEEQRFLRAHLAECVECRKYAEAAEEIIRAFRFQPLAIEPILVQQTRLRVRRRALEMQEQRERMGLVCLACLFVGLSGAITTPLAWHAFEWAGTWAGVSRWVWEAGFAALSIGPALIVSGLLLARGTHLSSQWEEQWN